MQKQQQKSKNQLIEKLHQINRTIEQSKTIANNTNVELLGQREKLQNIHGLTKKTDEQLQKGNYIADGMMSFWTRIKHKLTGGYKYKADTTTEINSSQNNIQKSNNHHAIKSNTTKQQQNSEVNQWLDHLGNQIDDLKIIMNRTGQQLNDQDKLLKTINAKTDKNINNLTGLNKKAKMLLDK